MATVHIDKGLLKGLDLEEYTGDQLLRLAEPAHATLLKRGSFYRNKLGRAVYRGMIFSECSFAQSVLEHVSFYKCKFKSVDLTRTKFVNCFFFGCEFENCDPYYATFENTEVNPTSFKNCYHVDSDWNKALVLFSELRRSLLASGDGRLSRTADYYFRSWQRRRLHHLWKIKQMSGFFPWFWNLCLWLLTGYGERPAYLLFWALGVISAIAMVYTKFFPFVVTAPKHSYLDFWYFSFQVFFGKWLSASLQTTGLFIVQLFEFGCGLVLIALLIASVTRKLSP
jgi:hypothetical protein